MLASTKMFEITNLILSVLTFVTLVIYAYFTYLIAKDVYEPFVSFYFSQIPVSPSSPSPSHLGFSMVNKGKVEVEVLGKLWSKVNKELFEFKEGFYGNEHSWILQPFTEVHGHFELKEIVNRKGIKLMDFLKKNKLSSLEFIFQIKYRKIGGSKWKISSPQKFIYNFDTNLFWSK